MSHLLIDAEMILYRSATGAESEIEWEPDCWTYTCDHRQAIVTFLDEVAALREVAPSHQPVLAFGDAGSFRYGVFPGYKANRKKLRKPAGYLQLMQMVEDRAAGYGWTPVRFPGLEGDDALGILQDGDSIIASGDKDLLTIPGLHLRDGEVIQQSEAAADLAFYIQAFMGDATDGYPGCPKIGKVTAAKALTKCQNGWEMWRTILAGYAKEGLSPAYALQMARCARILRAGEYDIDKQVPILWEPPSYQP